MRFSRVTPLMHRRRLPVSVRARGCVTLPAFRVLWLWVSRAIGPMVWLVYSGVLVVIARWTAQMVWYSASSSARSQPSCWMTSEMWSLRLRPLTSDDPRAEVEDFLHTGHLRHSTRSVHAHAVSYDPWVEHFRKSWWGKMAH